MKNEIVILCLLIFTSVCVAGEKVISDLSEKPDVIFLLGGQSNMAGNGFTPDLPMTKENEVYRSAPRNVSIWSAKEKRWNALEIGKRFGPEIGFGHTLASALPDQHIGIVKHAVGGTSMDKWTPGGKLYTQLMVALSDAREAAPNATLEAVIWHQGESDSDSKVVANAYKSKLTNHIASIRRDTKDSDLLFILGQINPSKSFCGKVRFQYADVVRNAQESIDIPNTITINTDDCPMNAYVKGAARTPKAQRIESNSDGIHYSATGQIKMGTRFAEAYLKSRNK